MPVEINELQIQRPPAPGQSAAAAPDPGAAALAGLARLVRILQRDDVLSAPQCREIAAAVEAKMPGAAVLFP